MPDTLHHTALVTGANGFIGRHISRELSALGYQVVGIGHGKWEEAEWKAWGIGRWAEQDIHRDALVELNITPSLIFHCAGGGSVAYSIDHPLSDFERTVTATANVLEYARLYAPLARIVYPSSASVYGTVATVPIQEESPILPISQYGIHKLMAEQMVLSYGRQFNLPVVIVRLFSVYGNGLRKQLLWDACKKLHAGDFSFMGTGEETRDWLHVEDAASLLIHASGFASSQCPVVNGGTGEGVVVRDIVSCLCNILACGAQPCFTGTARIGDPMRYIAAMDRLSAWNWQPTKKWRDGITAYAEWWKAEHAVQE
ncbi:NAD(P)-dependent oxidoreductase [Terriglobus sp. TAA 43]|uniref:NAD-dependent epimerase/dehydratase family protein n=1 Tax=Terriglobus sp. TAA 43 TaxID=278961 RepID=UPI000645AE33|nr:SDR family oxidoreductase [Terriglobus sp. TAA 43]